jgi:DNA-binding MarR family transcriptional regulator
MTDPTLRLDDFLPYRLSVTSNLVSDRIAQSYRALFGLTIPEWRMIAVLAEHAGATQQEIGTRTRMDKVTISRAAIALATRTLVERVPNPADGRSHCLSLTASGSELHARIAPKALAMEREIFGSFAPDRLRAFEAMLRDVEAKVAGLAG